MNFNNFGRIKETNRSIKIYIDENLFEFIKKQ
jgi:hypothetical protein